MVLKKKVEYWPNSKSIKEVYMVDEQGMKQGLSESFYQDGSLWGKTQYKNNKLEGPFIRYYSDGVILEKGTYHEGWLDGECELYDKNGKLIRKSVYSHGWLDASFVRQRNSGR